MKNATELNSVTAKVLLNKESKKFNLALNYADNDLAITMEEASKRGANYIWVKKPKKIKWKYVRSYLEQNDFKVFGLFNYCRIGW